MSGLEALTANYTDSEDEDRRSGEEDEEIAQSEAPNPTLERLRVDEGNESSTSGSRAPSSARSTPAKLTRLVSYGAEEKDDDEGLSEVNTTTEDVDKNNEPVDMELDTEDDDLKEQVQKGKTEGESAEAKTEDAEEILEERPPKVDAWTEGMLQLPPEPPGSCSLHLQEIVNRVHQKKVERGYDMNAVIQDMKSFKEP